jgi:exopolysaccharide biosynthesis protein
MNCRSASGPRPGHLLRRSAFFVLSSAFVVLSSPFSVLRSAPAAQDIDWRRISAGVEHAHITRDAPWNIHVLRLDPSRARLDVVHARDDAVGLETTSAIAKRHGAVAAINGGYFRMTGTFAGDSTGTLQIDGKILSEPDRGRAAVGLVRSGATTRLVMGHVTWDGSVVVNGARRRLNGVNRARGANEIVLFTPGFNQTTLTDDTGAEAIIRGGRVSEVRDAAGSSTIPPDGFVISATGTARTWLKSAMHKNRTVSLSVSLRPVDRGAPNPWKGAEDILGAGPKLVTAGKVNITAAREKMLATFATDRHPRTAVATLRDGRVLLMVVDGRQPSLSIGMSLDEVARFLIELGAVEAINMDGGGSTTMVVQGAIVNRPSDPTGERPVSDAILVTEVKQ